MKVTVLKRYNDSEQKRALNVGETIEVTNTQRIELLKSKGLIEVPTKVSESLADDEQPEPKKRGRKSNKI